MGVFFAFRLAVYLATTEAVSMRVIGADTAIGPGTLWQAVKAIRARIEDDGELDEELAAVLSAMVGYSVTVATYAEGTDLRKLQIRYSRAPTGGTLEDVAVTTHSFLKAPGGTPSSTWTDPGDYTTIENAFATAWTTLKAYAPTYLRLDQFRWYLDNAAMRLPDHAPNPAIRIAEVDVVATDSGMALPPQCSISVTEITAARKSWGRFYLPLNGDAGIDAAGRFSFHNTVCDTVKTFYNTCRAAGLIPVVYAPGLPARSSAAAKRVALATGPGTEPELDIPARTGLIYEVTSVQVDDLYDVIRSRRWDRPVARTTLAVT